MRVKMSKGDVFDVPTDGGIFKGDVVVPGDGGRLRSGAKIDFESSQGLPVIGIALETHGPDGTAVVRRERP